MTLGRTDTPADRLLESVRPLLADLIDKLSGIVPDAVSVWVDGSVTLGGFDEQSSSRRAMLIQNPSECSIVTGVADQLSLPQPSPRRRRGETGTSVTHLNGVVFTRIPYDTPAEHASLLERTGAVQAFKVWARGAGLAALRLPSQV